MSGQTNSSKVLGASSTAGVATLPFTGSHPVAIYIALTAFACAGIVAVSKVVKRFALRNVA
jgi:hypothetical protein